MIQKAASLNRAGDRAFDEDPPFEAAHLTTFESMRITKRRDTPRLTNLCISLAQLQFQECSYES